MVANFLKTAFIYIPHQLDKNAYQLKEIATQQHLIYIPHQLDKNNDCKAAKSNLHSSSVMIKTNRGQGRLAPTSIYIPHQLDKNCIVLDVPSIQTCIYIPHQLDKNHATRAGTF